MRKLSEEEIERIVSLSQRRQAPAGGLQGDPL
jgi:hypothetical protein